MARGKYSRPALRAPLWHALKGGALPCRQAICRLAKGRNLTYFSEERWFVVVQNRALRADTLKLEVHDLDVDVLTGVYSEETHLPQPLRISLIAELMIEDHYAPETPLSASKSYMDLKFAATDGIAKDVHFTLIEAVADHIADTVFLQDDKVLTIEIRIVKLATAEANESIGITMKRHRSAAISVVGA